MKTGQRCNLLSITGEARRPPVKMIAFLDQINSHEPTPAELKTFTSKALTTRTRFHLRSISVAPHLSPGHLFNMAHSHQKWGEYNSFTSRFICEGGVACLCKDSYPWWKWPLSLFGFMTSSIGTHGSGEFLQLPALLQANQEPLWSPKLKIFKLWRFLPSSQCIKCLSSGVLKRRFQATKQFHQNALRNQCELLIKLLRKLVTFPSGFHSFPQNK